MRSTVGSGTDKLSPFGAAAIVAFTFFVMGLLVYFVAGRTLWDLLQLLVIPLALVSIGLWFTAQQDARQQESEEQRAQDEALQAYLDQMGTLLLEHDLRNSEEDSEVQTLARARTVTVIQRLDADGNRNVIRFLREANLTGSITGSTTDITAPFIVAAPERGSHHS
jgi:hypothetical protein